MKGVRGIFRGRGGRDPDSSGMDESFDEQEDDIVSGMGSRSTDNRSTHRDRPSYTDADHESSQQNGSMFPEDDEDEFDAEESFGKLNKSHDASFEKDQKSSNSTPRKSSQSTPGRGNPLTMSVVKSKNIAESAGTHRLNRILNKTQKEDGNDTPQAPNPFATGNGASAVQGGASNKQQFERIEDPKDMESVGKFVARLVLPPLKVDPHSIGGATLEKYPQMMQQETLLCYRCQQFESTGNDSVTMSALQYPSQYASHKRRLGLLSTVGTKGRNKYRYVIIARSSNRPVIPEAASLIAGQDDKTGGDKRTDGEEEGAPDDASDRGDYDTMFAPEDISESIDGESTASGAAKSDVATPAPVVKRDISASTSGKKEAASQPVEDEASSFPVLICMSLNSDGSAPDVRKLIPLDQLTTVQNLQSTVVQLAFRNGDTVRLDFGDRDGNEDKNVEGSLNKERFIWSLLQIHAMLCTSVAERASHMAGNQDRIYIPPLNVRNLDRAELQYVATVNGFLTESEVLQTLLDRQRVFIDNDGVTNAGLRTTTAHGEEKVELEEMDHLAYSLMMGNFNTRVSLFLSESERKDAEEVLNSTEWKESLSKEESTAVVSVAEKIGTMLQLRMRDLEAETCRRLIAWEDEKHYSSSGGSNVMSSGDDRDSVDALALATLFKMLETLDSELVEMEDWLQERAAAIKPLTDDCADIEEENRQLEQQWKSYDMLGAEMKRLLQGLEIDEAMEKILKNPASALAYDSNGRVIVEESEGGIAKIYSAGKKLLEAIEYPKKSGGMHLSAVSERADRLSEISRTYCTSLAQIIVTVMEQHKSDVVAESDNGKVSKSDTHATIARKIRDTQKKFQNALLGYIKPVEVLAALSPDLLPALRDAYAEMVSEGILMKKRCKGYFQALPGKNAAYMNRAGKDLKDYVPFDSSVREEGVNAPDIRNSLAELLPVIAREAYFTSALFGPATKEQDGREKKRNFESTRSAVDSGSQHFRYYINRTCGINFDDVSGRSTSEMVVKGDPLLNLVASICLNEAMDSYIDHEKKGGDHSLSLAYVRATILDLRKRADKQWVVWVEKQMEWIRSNDGVPLTGKRAGIFPSFARFPCYLDHVLMCCREGREEEYVPDMGHIKVINYYLQKMAATLLESLKEASMRDTTEKEYAANVMQMENTYFFTQSIKARGPTIADLFSKQMTKANALCKESTDAYLGWMIKKEFTILHELFSRLSRIRKEYGDKEVPEHVDAKDFVRTLTKEASREILKDRISSMHSRMGKHLSEEGGLLPVAWKALVKVLFEWFGRWEKLSASIYKHKLDPGALDVVRIAKAAGGASKPKPSQSGNEFGFKSILALKNKDKM